MTGDPECPSGRRRDRPWQLAIIRSGRRAFRHVVAGIAVGETVGHDEVDHVIAGDALESPSPRQPR